MKTLRLRTPSDNSTERATNVPKENTVINTAYAIKQNVNVNERVVHVRVNVNSIKNVNAINCNLNVIPIYV